MTRERSIWAPRLSVARSVVEQRRKAQGLSQTETFHLIENLHGRELLASQPVQNLLQYTGNWEPFIVNRNPQVTPDASLSLDTVTAEIHLPYPFIIPSKQEGAANQWGNMQFYWDMYFINKALLATKNPQYIELAKGHVKNFEYLFDRLGYIPNASGMPILNRTQVPFLTGMILDIYKVTGDKQWLAEKMEFAQREYHNVWMYTEKEGKERGIKRPSHRIDEESLLVRAVGTDIVKEHYVAAAMTGEDDSAQWARRAYEYLPVTLNCALYKYESDFAFAAKELAHRAEYQQWQDIATRRKREINETFWDKGRGMYFDAVYNRRKKTWGKDTHYRSLTTFMPLWVNLATQEQADSVVSQIKQFESPYGLMIASRRTKHSELWAQIKTRIAFGLSGKYRRYIPAVDDIFSHQQWDYPNIWAPTEYFAIDGMLNYGHIAQAQKAIEHTLRAAAAFYQEKGTLGEKINGLTGLNGSNYEYGDQEGFGWHNAVCEIAAGRLMDITKNVTS